MDAIAQNGAITSVVKPSSRPSRSSFYPNLIGFKEYSRCKNSKAIREILAVRVPSQKREPTVRMNLNSHGSFFSNVSYMEDIYEALANKLMATLEILPGGERHYVALAGPPGAGKSTVAKEVTNLVNKRWRNKTGSEDTVAVDLPMDGFHLYRWQLDQFEDPKEAHARRGAPWTFNPASLAQHLSEIKQKGHGYLPSFDHGVGDPVEKDIYVGPKSRIIIMEGNYLLFEGNGWAQIKSYFDEKWFVEADIEEAMRRVESRHVATGKPAEVAKWRVQYNDRPNAEMSLASRANADLVFPSLPLKARPV